MTLDKIFTIIPTGGEGKRLRPFTESRSKPLVPVINNFPILEFILYSLTRGAGMRNFIFGVKGTKHYVNLQNYFQGGAGWSGKLGITPQAHFEYQNPNYFDEGSADSVRYNIEEYGITNPILVCQADNLFSGQDIRNLYNHALISPFDITVGLSCVDDGSQLGVAKMDPTTNQITEFLEKPGDKYKCTSTVSTGIYVIKPQAFLELKKDFGKDVIPALTAKGKVGGYVFEHPWYDFGDPQKHLASVMDLLKKPTPCFSDFLSRICTLYKTPRANVWIRGKSLYSIKRVREIIKNIEEGKISVEGNIFIGKSTVIGEGVRLKDCAIGDLAFIGEETEITGSNILDGWQIGSNCSVRGSFFGRGGLIKSGETVENQFLGDNQVI